MRLNGKTALITGGSSGIGRAIAFRFGAEGARIAVAGWEKEPLEHTVSELTALGVNAVAVCGDVQKAAAVTDMVQTVVNHWGTIDVLVSNAGICRTAPFLEITEEDWDLHLSINLKGTFLVGQAVARVMAKRSEGGSIINVSSVNGLAAEADQAHYNASKGGMNMLTMSMALELAPLGIRVNALCPGFIETRLTKPLIENPAALGPYLRSIPMGRVGQPEEIADAALFLASEESRYMTGHCLVVDGGQYMKLS